MSNNRMWLIRGDKKILLAKYYPSTGWYQFCTEDQLNSWFDEVRRDFGMTGDTDIELGYEEKTE